MEHVVNDAVHQALALLAIDSPSGYTGKAAEYAYHQLKELGFDPQYSRKGAVLVNLTPHLPQEDGLLLLAHLDTLGGMITRITGEGPKLWAKCLRSAAPVGVHSSPSTLPP